jgi:hypothetical protein
MITLIMTWLRHIPSQDIYVTAMKSLNTRKEILVKKSVVTCPIEGYFNVL